MTAPTNVKISDPTIPVTNWSIERAKWLDLNEFVKGNPDFYPLTIKAAYVIGIIHDICSSVSCLINDVNVKNTTYIPAYAIFASSVDILGRCVVGNPSPGNGNIRDGFKWIASTSYKSISSSHILIATKAHRYSIDELVTLRNFAAHGQATSKNERFSAIDYELLSKMPPILADGLERYWKQLQSEECLCNKLAKANILALRSHPVLKSWKLFEKDATGSYHSITDIFNRFNWHVKM